MMDCGKVLHRNVAMTYLQVLVVDDSPITVAKLSRMLQTLGHRVLRTASSGAEAVTAYETYKPDVVTMDLTMPEMDGVESITELLRLFPRINILVVSALSDKSTAIAALRQGARGFLPKPFTDDELRLALLDVTEAH